MNLQIQCKNMYQNVVSYHNFFPWCHFQQSRVKFCHNLSVVYTYIFVHWTDVVFTDISYAIRGNHF